MCLSDWRVGRLIRSQLRQLDAASGPSYTIPGNRQRVGIRFIYAETAGTSAQFLGGVVDGIALILVGFQNPNTLFTIETDGDLPTKEWTLVASAAIDFAVIEYFLPEDVLAAGIQQFRSAYKP